MTAGAWEPLRSPDGATVLAWPDETNTFATCGGGRGDPDAQIELWDAMALWWREGGARQTLGFDAGPCPLDAADATIAVVRVDDPDGWDPAWGGAEQVIGFTIHTHDGSGRLIDADIAFNDAHFQLEIEPADDTGAVDLRWLAAHELGHALGLGHPCGEAGGAVPSCFDLPDDALTDALMFPSVAAGARTPALAADDRAGLAAVLDAGAPPSAPPACLDGGMLEVDAAADLVSWATIDATGDRAGGAVPPAASPAPSGPFLVDVELDSGVRWIGRVAPCPITAAEDADEDEDEDEDEELAPGDATDIDEAPDDLGSAARGGDGCACRSTSAAVGVTLPGSGMLALLALLVLPAARRRRTRRCRPARSLPTP